MPDVAESDPEPATWRKHPGVQIQRRAGVQPPLRARRLRGGLPGQNPEHRAKTDAKERRGAVGVPQETARWDRQQLHASGPKENKNSGELFFYYLFYYWRHDAGRSDGSIIFVFIMIFSSGQTQH